ncbi:MAG: aminoacyl-tRNA hydrolase [Chloroflexi bacterium]|nr:aminoacyl-tRNA hydrolase [Chloroflexota bacterium]
MLAITPSLAIPDSEFQETFFRASGPGGQNVNKVATAVEIRFDVRHSPSLSNTVRDRLIRLAGKRLTSDGVLIIEAQRFRTQDQNRQEARQRLIALIRQATVAPKRRRPTRPTLASKHRRMDSKRKRGTIKKLRRGSINVD